jgi:hypothetical protein
MEDAHGAFGVGSSHVRDSLDKDEEDFGYQNLTEEGIAQQAKENISSEGDEEDEKKEATRVKYKIFRSETNL